MFAAACGLMDHPWRKGAAGAKAAWASGPVLRTSAPIRQAHAWPVSWHDAQALSPSFNGSSELVNDVFLLKYEQQKKQ